MCHGRLIKFTVNLRGFKMKRILIYYPPNKLGMSDFAITDYTKLHERVKKELNGKFPNVGNKVWLQGITSVITTQDCVYEFGYQEIPEEIINQKYDCVLLPLANCFYAGWMKYMKVRTQHIKKLKVPVYVIACGVQADSYDDINTLVDEIREPATEFIQAVYNTGGQFALRGYFTAEFFEKLGFHDAVVTGCPSLFQMGVLQIPTSKVKETDFKATINGTFKLPINHRDIEKSNFICQNTYGNLLYDPEYFENNPYTIRRVLRDIRRGDYEMVKAIADQRIHLFVDTQQWMSYFVQNNISFSFGSRIHGTVMPILSGVPALLYSCDARTREMAEFFDIPYIMQEQEEKYDIYELYMKTDYSKFNKNFVKRYEAYEKFLEKCGITSGINRQNIFMSRTKENVEYPYVVNKRYQEKLQKKLSCFKILFDITERYYNKKER